MEQLKFELLRRLGFDPQQLYPVELVLALLFFLLLLLLLLIGASGISAPLVQVDAIVRVGSLVDCLFYFCLAHQFSCDR